MEESEKILSLFKKNEQLGFQLLHDSYHDSLLLFATQLLGDAEEAADIVQECFVDFWVNQRFNKLRGNVKHYLFSAVKHGCLNYLRNTQRRERKQEWVREELYDEGGEKNFELIEKLYLSIESLPEERRKILHMVCIEGMKYQAVADQLGISINTVKTQMGRAFQFLRENFKKEISSLLVIFFQKKSKSLSPKNDTLVPLG